MMTTEAVSEQLIGKFEKLKREVAASFQRTDELLSQHGLTRDMLGPLLKKVMERLPPAERERLAKLQESWELEIEQELAQSSLTPPSGTEQTRPWRSRAQLVDKI